MIDVLLSGQILIIHSPGKVRPYWDTSPNPNHSSASPNRTGGPSGPVVKFYPVRVFPQPQRGLNMDIIIISYTLWLFNIAMENGPFIDDFPIKTSMYKGFSMAMLNNQRVLYIIHN